MTSLGILKIITLIVFFIVTIFVFSKNKRWIKFSQGLKPLLLGLLLLLMAALTQSEELNVDNINDFLKILILYDSTKYFVNYSYMIALGYILLVSGLEISLIVLVKQFRGREKPKN
jgi:energy-coupling factor transporter transmembrane protein EcfT